MVKTIKKSTDTVHSKKTAKTKKNEPAAESLDLSVEGIRAVIDFTKDFRISALSLKDRKGKITITKDINLLNKKAVPADSGSSRDNVLPEKEAVLKKTAGASVIKSGYVGIYHPLPGIEAGKSVKQGEHVANIYSMKMEHKVYADKDCILANILVNENDPVDWGKPLFAVK